MTESDYGADIKINLQELNGILQASNTGQVGKIEVIVQGIKETNQRKRKKAEAIKSPDF